MKPNFFIIGGHRSGTTSMYHYLKQHPDIFMSEKKEPSYFSDFRVPLYNLKSYLALFDKVDKEKIVGEASVSYILSEDSAIKIKEFAPNAKILIMLRNPIERVYSNYKLYYSSFMEDIDNFEGVLKAEKERKNGKMYPKNMKGDVLFTGDAYIKNLFYMERAMCAKQINKYLELFGRKNVLIIFQEDLHINQENVYKEVLDFLGVDNTFIPDFTRQNENRIIPLKIYRNIIVKSQFISGWKKNILGSIFPLHVRNNLRKLSVKKNKREEMKPETRKYLVEVFSDEITELEKITGRDLSHWRIVK